MPVGTGSLRKGSFQYESSTIPKFLSVTGPNFLGNELLNPATFADKIKGPFTTFLCTHLLGRFHKTSQSNIVTIILVVRSA